MQGAYHPGVELLDLNPHNQTAEPRDQSSHSPASSSPGVGEPDSLQTHSSTACFSNCWAICGCSSLKYFKAYKNKKLAPQWHTFETYNNHIWPEATVLCCIAVEHSGTPLQRAALVHSLKIF